MSASAARSFESEPPDLRFRIAERYAIRALNELDADAPGGPAQRLAAAIYLILECSYEVDIAIAERREIP